MCSSAFVHLFLIFLGKYATVEGDASKESENVCVLGHCSIRTELT